MAEAEELELEDYTVQGATYLQAGRFAEAIAAFSAAIQLAPTVPAGFNNRGTAYAQAGQPAAALSDFNRAISLAPDYALAYNNRGFAYRQLDRTAEALADYAQVLALEPDNAQAQFNRGLAQVEAGAEAAAINAFAAFLRASRPLAEQLALEVADTIYAPTYARACTVLAAEAAQRSDCDDAQEWLRMASLIQPGFVSAYLQGSRDFATCAAGDWQAFVARLR